MKLFKELYLYRELLKSNIKKEIRGKYKGSFLGVLWSFVNPLLMVLVYAIVFPLILRVKEENYVIFLIVGTIPWTFFTTVISQGTTTVLGNANIIKKVYFPRAILPISVVTSGLVNFLISCIIIFLFLIFGGIGISGYIIYLPIVILIEYIFSLAVVFILSAINVYIRDVEYIMNFVIMMLFYATPVLYSLNTIPDKYQWIFKLNPMAHIINGYRDIFYYQQTPNLLNLLVVGTLSILLLLIGYNVFKKLEKGFAEEV
jgi:ABC-type polysaccharide/polyol phosphate export permease